MEKLKISPSPHQNLITDFHQNWHMYWTAPEMQNFITVGSGFLLPKYVTLTCSGEWLVLMIVFLGCCNLLQPKSLIFTHNMSNHVVSVKDVPFEVPMTKSNF